MTRNICNPITSARCFFSSLDLVAFHDASVWTDFYSLHFVLNYCLMVPLKCKYMYMSHNCFSKINFFYLTIIYCRKYLITSPFGGAVLHVLIGKEEERRDGQRECTTEWSTNNCNYMEENSLKSQAFNSSGFQKLLKSF